MSQLTLRLLVSERGDGGVRVRSDDVPGLLASAKDVEWLWQGLPISIAGLLKGNRGILVDDVDLGPPPVLAAGGSVLIEAKARARTAA